MPPGQKSVDKVPLPYWRAALAEVSLLHPEVPPESKPIHIGPIGGGWAVTHAEPSVREWTEAQFAASKFRSDKSRTIPYVLIAARLSEQASHGVKTQSADVHKGHSLLCVPCLLDRNGGLWPDPERHPWIPRNLLEPTSKPLSVGPLARYDEFISQLPPKATSLGEALLAAADLFRVVTDANLPVTLCEADEPNGVVFAMDGYEVVCELHGVAYEPPVIARHLIKLYDQIVQDQPALPLLDNLRSTRDRPTRPPLELIAAEVQHTRIFGHMNRKHPLSPSQREAMVELSQLQDGHILAVNGPPGTGKTTLLQSVVAQLWIDAALKQAECPLVLVTSTNVKAVENVLDSFGKICGEIGHLRWHPYDKGMGLFMASQSRETKHPTYTGNAHCFAEHETPAGVEQAEKYFLARACEHFKKEFRGVPAVVKTLHSELTTLKRRLKLIIQARHEIFRATEQGIDEGAKTGCLRLLSEWQKAMTVHEEIVSEAEQLLQRCGAQTQIIQATFEAACAEINRAEQAWQGHLISVPLWLDLLSILPPVRRRRAARDRHFLLSSPFTTECQDRDSDLVAVFNGHRTHAHSKMTSDLAAVQRDVRKAEQRRAEALKQLQAIHQTHESLNKIFLRWLDAIIEDIALEDVSLADLNDALDLKIRAPMFSLTDWYWSGQWLLEMKQRLAEGLIDSKGRAKRESQYRRFAKLAPCLVSNFHMASTFFTGWLGRDVAIPFWNAIDLLIVDEAGQVAPDVGAGMFALAKRALVVGDVHQIEPVWNTGESIDRANATKFEWIASPRDSRYEHLSNDGYTAAQGNLMKMANRACSVQKYPDARGLMLTEHRRCVPELIDYCNQLVYSGRLEPLREALSPHNRLFPTFGHLNVSAKDRRVGGSRSNPVEAQAIVDWIRFHRDRIEAHYTRQSGETKPLWKLLGIVTPFASQAAAIERVLHREMPDLKHKNTRLTVGTVHALQGAEREIVIFSPTYGESFSGGAFFDQSVNMLNVAVSRAKDSFLVIGNLALFNAAKRGQPSGLLASYLFHPEHSAAL